MMNPFAALTMLLALTLAAKASGAQPFPGADPNSGAVRVQCPRPLPPGEVDGRTLVCGRLPVPLDPESPGAGSMELFFALLRSRSAAPAADPLVFLHGGPGGGALERLADEVLPGFDRYRRSRDVLAFDQRGAGLSAAPTLCRGTLVDALDDIASAASAPQALRAILPRCLEEIMDRGPGLAVVDRGRNAGDVARLTLALGYDEFNLHGISYGSQVALEAMRQAPKGLRSVVLDGVLPPDLSIMDRSLEPLAEATQAVLDQCEADPRCSEAHPDLDATLDRVAARLTAQPLATGAGGPPADLSALLQVLAGRNGVGFPKDVTGRIPGLLGEWDRGETQAWTRLVQSVQAMRGADEPSSPEADANPTRAAAAKFRAELARAVRDAGGVAAMNRLLLAEATAAGEPASRTVLARLVEVNLPGALGHESLERIQAMSDDVLAAVFEDFDLLFRKVTAEVRFWLELTTVACRTFLPANSVEGHAAFVATLRFPFLAAADPVAPLVFELCEAFPSPPVRRPDAPVLSAVPTMLLAGLNDVQTAPSWAVHAAETLVRSQVVMLPETGHGAVLFSDCARDLAARFVDSPTDPLDLGCVEDLRPVFAP